MSERAPEAPEAIELPPLGDTAFGALMDTLVADAEATAPAEGAAPVGTPAGTGAGAAAGTTGAPAAPATGEAGEPAAAGTAGAGGEGAEGDAGGGAEQSAAVPGEGDRPAAWTATAAQLIPQLGELSTAIEEKVSQVYQSQSLEAVKGEYNQYFESLEKHPRLLVGTQVPAIGKEGMETLRDTDDAREWQEAVKSILVAEVRDRAGRQMEESSDFLATVHQSIELFQNNVDLVPGTKDFDVELANRFATMAQPYELRVEGKLNGYSIPVQPIISQLRTQLAAERAANPAPATPATPAAPAAAQTAEAPQAGITGKAGSGSSTEDFSTLFGTIGLPNLQI